MDFELCDVDRGVIRQHRPALAVRFPPAEAKRLKDAGHSKAVREGRRHDRTWWERSFIACTAVACVTEARGEPSPVENLPIIVNGRTVEVDTKTQRHRDLSEQDEPLIIQYPVDRRRADYFLAASVLTDEDGGSLLFLWGALDRPFIEEALATRERHPGIRPGDSDYIDLFLDEFDGELLRSLLAETE